MSNIQQKRVREKRWRRKRAHMRLRNRLQGTDERPRLAVHKSRKYIYAQLIDDGSGHTVAQASSLEPAVRATVEASPASKAAARLVGETIAKRAGEKGVKTVVFDRGGFIYHGRIKEVAEGARAEGLEF